MSYQRERDAFIARLAAIGIPSEVSRKFLREAATIERLAVAACNGDWPCDNGERKVNFCAKCEGGYVPSQLNGTGVCPSCRAEQRVSALAKAHGIAADCQGDPRGYTTQLILADGSTVGVPVRA